MIRSTPREILEFYKIPAKTLEMLLDYSFQ